MTDGLWPLLQGGPAATNTTYLACFLLFLLRLLFQLRSFQTVALVVSALVSSVAYFVVHLL